MTAGPAADPTNGPRPDGPRPDGTPPTTSPDVSSPAASTDTNGAPPLGTAGAIGLEAMAPDGRWVAYCQPTTDTNGDGELAVSTDARGALVGDLPDVHLSLGGEVTRIDELLGHDDSGRWLVIRDDDKPWLIDSRSGERTDLSPLAPDLRSDELFELAHRSFAFDAQGTRLLVLSHPGKHRYEAHLLTLPSRSDARLDLTKARKIQLPPGEVWRAELAPDGSWLVLHALLKHADRPTNLQWPAPPRTEPLRRCHGAFKHAGAWAQRGGQITALLASTRDPNPRPTPGFVMPVGDGWLRRERNGRLMLVRGSTQKQVASERCGARVLHGDPTRELFLISCEHYALDPPKTEGRKKAPPKYRFELYLVAPGFVGDLQADVAATRLDRPPKGSPRLVPLRPGARSVLVDMDRRRAIDLRSDDRIVSTYGPRALVRRGRGLFVYDAERDRELPIEGSIEAFPEIRGQGRYVYVEPVLVDLAEARAVLRHDTPPLAVSDDGRLLAPTRAADGESWAQGPLRWIAAPATSSDAPGATHSAD